MKHFKIFSFVFFCLPLINYAQTALDTSFNRTGMIKAEYGACEHLFIQSDNKIIVCGYDIDGYYAIVRLNEKGSIDYHFANHGAFSLCHATDISFLNDGKLLMSTVTTNYYKPGWESEDFTCFKLNEDWSLDTSFGNEGRVVTDIARWWHGYWWEHDDDITSSVAVQSDGRVVLFGTSGYDIALTRYTQDGKIDSTFGLYGVASCIVGQYGKETNDMAILPDDRLIVGFRASINGQGAMCAMRFLPDGAIDSSFNQTGYAYYSDGWLTYCNAMCLQPDGKVLLAGYADSALIVRFDTSGALDPTFGHGGVCKLPPAAIRDMALAPDGKILVTGTKDSSFVVYRCLPNGVLDTTFGNHGMILTKIETGEEDRAECIALQQDGKILVGGSSQFPGTHTPEFVLARYLPDGHANNFGQNGRLLIYPNPAADRLNIELLNGKETLAQITIYDVYGRLVLRQNNERLGTVAINIAGLASGLYFVHIRGNNGLGEEHKFVKK